MRTSFFCRADRCGPRSCRDFGRLGCPGQRRRDRHLATATDHLATVQYYGGGYGYRGYGFGYRSYGLLALRYGYRGY